MADAAREVLDRDIENLAAYQYLRIFDEKVAIPENKPFEEKILTEFKTRFEHDFKIIHRRHFLIIYDTTEAFANQRGAALEQAYDSFMYYFNMKQLHPHFLSSRLNVILFKSRQNYLSYARRTEGADLSWSAGYYSQRTNRSAFYDDSTGPAAESVDKRLATLKDRRRELNTQISDASGSDRIRLIDERDKISNEIFEITTRMGNVVGLLNNVKTVHEAIHQLAFNTGIQKRLIDYPLWFTEGLACAFETQDHNNNRGPGVMNWGRIAGVKAAMAHNKLIPLEDLIASPRPEKFDEQTLGVYYAESWAIFHYMYKFHRPALERYLLAFHDIETLRVLSAEERKKLFTDAFGADIPGFEKKFLAYLKQLPNLPPK